MNTRGKSVYVVLFLGALAILALSQVGCAGSIVYHDGVAMMINPMYVGGPPPSAKADVQKSEAPSKKHVWVDGYWGWNEVDGQWAWRNGKWVEPPVGDYELQVANYEQRGANWVYTPPYWTQKQKPTEQFQYPAPITPSSVEEPETPAEPIKPETPEQPAEADSAVEAAPETDLEPEKVAQPAELSEPAKAEPAAVTPTN